MRMARRQQVHMEAERSAPGRRFPGRRAPRQRPSMTRVARIGSPAKLPVEGRGGGKLEITERLLKDIERPVCSGVTSPTPARRRRVCGQVTDTTTFTAEERRAEVDAWLYETCTQCLQHMVDVVALFYAPVAPLLPRILDLLANFVRCAPYPSPNRACTGEARFSQSGRQPGECTSCAWRSICLKRCAPAALCCGAGRQARRREARLCRRVRWPARRCSAAWACARIGMESPRPALDAMPARGARCQRRDARSE